MCPFFPGEKDRQECIEEEKILAVKCFESFGWKKSHCGEEHQFSSRLCLCLHLDLSYVS